MYPKITCECGRDVGSNVFRQHARKCAPQLRKWAAEGHAVYLLDERSAPRGSDSIEKDALDDEDEDEYHEDRDRDP